MTGDEFSERMRTDADLEMWLCEQVFSHYSTLHLNGQDYEPIGSDEVPGYEDEEYAVLLRRKSDGEVFEAEFDVNVHPVRKAVKP